jgi:hypothetical protein
MENGRVEKGSSKCDENYLYIDFISLRIKKELEKEGVSHDKETIRSSD